MKLSSSDFRLPKTITHSDFYEICRTSHIQSLHQVNTKKRLDELVKEFRKRMKANLQHPSRKSDRQRIKNAISFMEKAADRIDLLGPSGLRAIRTISDTVAPMLAAQWLNQKFPDDDYAPQRSALPVTSGLRELLRTPLRQPEYFIEEKSFEARLEFVQQRPIKTTKTILREIKQGLEAALRSLDLQPRSKGGQEPLTYRHYLIINLAEIWEKCGGKVVGTSTSDFASFCEAVAESIGWPTDGMSSEIPKALKDWRNLLKEYRR